MSTREIPRADWPDFFERSAGAIDRFPNAEPELARTAFDIVQ